MEVRTSLHTREVKTAIRLARKLSVLADEVFTRVMNTLNSGQGFALAIQQIKLVFLELNGIELDPDKPGELDQLESMIQRLGPAALPAPALSQSVTSISGVIAAYCTGQVQIGAWTSKTEQEYRAIYQTCRSFNSRSSIWQAMATSNFNRPEKVCFQPEPIIREV